MCSNILCQETACGVDYGCCHCGCGEMAPLGKANRYSHKTGKYNKVPRLERRGVPRLFIRGHNNVGEGNPRWVGGRVFGNSRNGYRSVYVDRRGPLGSMASKNGCAHEHRVVVAGLVGRPLESCEVVHHVNRQRSDNRPENLWLFADVLSHRQWHDRVEKGLELTATMRAVPLRFTEDERANLADLRAQIKKLKEAMKIASDAYISSYDKAGAKTTHINSAGAISATMQYAIWDKVSLSARLVFPDSTTAETELRALFLTGKNDGRFAIITVPK